MHNDDKAVCPHTKKETPGQKKIYLSRTMVIPHPRGH
jgi:hypothetical protein